MSPSNEAAEPARELPTSTARNTLTVRDHAEVVRIATDPERFSSTVSRFLQIPNGLDGPEHRRFRVLVERYFTAEALAQFAPACRRVARDLVDALPQDRVIDAVRDIGAPYAVRAQSAWLGWPPELERKLLDWLDDKLAAVRSGDAARNAEVAERFDALTIGLLEARRASDGSRDLTDRLAHDTSAGRPLRDDEIVAILRNWTGGDLATIALCVGVILHTAATRKPVDRRMREETSDAALDACLEEILRLDDPFTSSRRVATCRTHAAGMPVEKGQFIALDWAAANRDTRVFAPVGEFAPERNAAANLVYGIGPHVCPGRPLARLELRELVRALQAAFAAMVPAGAPLRETPPLGGFRTVPIRLHRVAPAERDGA